MTTGHAISRLLSGCGFQQFLHSLWHLVLLLPSVVAVGICCFCCCCGANLKACHCFSDCLHCLWWYLESRRSFYVPIITCKTLCKLLKLSGKTLQNCRTLCNIFLVNFVHLSNINRKSFVMYILFCVAIWKFFSNGGEWSACLQLSFADVVFGNWRSIKVFWETQSKSEVYLQIVSPCAKNLEYIASHRFQTYALVFISISHCHLRERMACIWSKSRNRANLPW